MMRALDTINEMPKKKLKRDSANPFQYTLSHSDSTRQTGGNHEISCS